MPFSLSPHCPWDGNSLTHSLTHSLSHSFTYTTTASTMAKSKSQKQKKSQKKVQQYLKKKGYKDKVVAAVSHSQEAPPAKRASGKSPHKNHSTTHSPAPSSSNGSGSGGKGKKGLSSLQQSFQKKLEGARFRVINERLYTCPGSEAFEEFQKNKSLFKVVSEFVKQ